LVLLGIFIILPTASTFAKDRKSMSQSKAKIIVTKKAPAAIGAYSQAMEINGTFYFSGQIGLDPVSMELKPTFETQVEQILKNIDALLEASNLERSNIVKSTIFLTDLANFGAVNAAYTEYFKERFPARSCVEASNLPKGALVEIEVIAHK
jgi:2-iminobutanoate/2-iminopropanoate deaminase